MNYDSLIILGPTASGKTDISIRLAHKLGSQIVNADSMYIYKNFDIGTAKPTNQEMQNIKHYLIDFVDPKVYYSVANFREDAKKVLVDLQSKNIFPIVVGGTGFYIDSLLNNYSYGGNQDQKLRHELEQELTYKGKEYLFEKLEKLDPITSKKLHPNDTKRVLRAIEICLTTKSRKSDIQNDNDIILKNPLIIGLDIPRQQLYDRINLRVDNMLKNGLLDEVKSLVKLGYTPDNSNAMKGIGYKELFSYLNGDMTYDEAVLKIKQHTRNYAKRQITWFKRNNNIVWLNPLSNDCINKILELLGK